MNHFASMALFTLALPEPYGLRHDPSLSAFPAPRRPAPSGYWTTPSGAIRRDRPRRVKMDPDSHHKATRRRARKLFRLGCAVPDPS